MTSPTPPLGMRASGERVPVVLIVEDDEVIANLYRRQEGLNIMTVRCSGMYGPIYRTFSGMWSMACST